MGQTSSAGLRHAGESGEVQGAVRGREEEATLAKGEEGAHWRRVRRAMHSLAFDDVMCVASDWIGSGRW